VEGRDGCLDYLLTTGEMCWLLQVDIGHALVGLSGGSRTAPRGCMVVAQHPRKTKRTQWLLYESSRMVVRVVVRSVCMCVVGLVCERESASLAFSASCCVAMIVGRVWRG